MKRRSLVSDLIRKKREVTPLKNESSDPGSAGGKSTHVLKSLYDTDSDEECVGSCSPICSDIEDEKHADIRIAKKRSAGGQRKSGTRLNKRSMLVSASVAESVEKLKADEDVVADMKRAIKEDAESLAAENYIPVADRLKAFLGSSYEYDEDLQEGGWFSPSIKIRNVLTVHGDILPKRLVIDGRQDSHSVAKLVHEDPLLMKVCWERKLMVNHTCEELTWVYDTRSNKVSNKSKYMIISGELLAQVYVAANCNPLQQNSATWARIQSAGAHIATVNIDKYMFTENIVNNTLQVAYFIYVSSKMQDMDYLNLWRHTNAIADSFMGTDMEKLNNQNYRKLKTMLNYGWFAIPYLIIKLMTRFVRFLRALVYWITYPVTLICCMYQALCVALLNALPQPCQNRIPNSLVNSDSLCQTGLKYTWNRFQRIMILVLMFGWTTVVILAVRRLGT